MKLTKDKGSIPINLKFFNDNNGTSADPVPRENPPPEKAESTDPPLRPTNYKELYGTDKGFQSYIDGLVTKATQTAVTNAIQKQQRITDDKLSESERLQAMTDKERAEYFAKKVTELERARTRDKEIDGLKAQTAAMLTEGGIPEVFLEVFDFDSATAEDVKKRVGMLAGYEYYPKGELEKRVAAALNEKLKQAPPETGGGSGGGKPPGIPKIF